jgi:hypothetical protein
VQKGLLQQLGREEGSAQAVSAKIKTNNPKTVPGDFYASFSEIAKQFLAENYSQLRRVSRMGLTQPCGWGALAGELLLCWIWTRC